MCHNSKKGGRKSNKGPVPVHDQQAELFPTPAQLPGYEADASLSRPLQNSKRLHRKKASEYLGISLSFLDKSRLKGTGPPFIRIGNRVVYSTDDLDQHMAERRHKSTAEYD